MTRYFPTSSVLTLLALHILASSLPLPIPHSPTARGDADEPLRDILHGLPVSEHMEQKQTVVKRQDEEQEEEEDLFKGVNPRKLAAVLLEALNKSHPLHERGRNEEGEVKEEEAHGGRTVRDRDGRQRLELLNVSQMKQRERAEEEERTKALEEEEKVTERVKSHTTSHVVQMEQQSSGSDRTIEPSAGFLKAPSIPEDEEQLNSEELKSLETVMKEFPRLNTKRGDDSEQKPRDSRSFSSFNDIIPKHKGSDLSWSEKKLKWQEETQKALHFPSFTGGNSIHESTDSFYNGKATQSTSNAEQEAMAEDGSEEEDTLSPEEEEAQAKEEQEEMMRQVAEAQRAKMEEEKLADIASDMLLHYMVKQDNGNKKYSSSLPNAAEDKRSNEDQDVTEEDDIDPQTIDKLIEISSKLHLPADDIVDIITDAEKKKKDMPPEIISLWHSNPSPLSSSSLSGWETLNNQNSFSGTRQPSPVANLLQAWFQEKKLPKSDALQRKPFKPLPAYHRFWPEPVKPLALQSLWAVYPSYPYTYSYYQKNPHLDHYPFYFHPLLRPKPYYHMPEPALALSTFPGDSEDDTFMFPPKRRYHSWVQPQLRKPPSRFQHKSYFTGYQPPTYRHPFQQSKDMSGTGVQPDSSSHDDLEKFIQQLLLNRPQTLG